MTKCAQAATADTNGHIRLRRSATVDVSSELGSLGPMSEAVLDALPFFFLLVDSQHTILFANRAVREALGDAGASVIGGYCPAVIHGLDAPFPGCPLEEAEKAHVAVERDFYEDSTCQWVSSAIYPTTLRTASGNVVYAHVVRDVSKRRRAEAAVRERAAVEQMISRLATHFLGASPEGTRQALGEALRMSAEFMGCVRYAEYVGGDAPGRLERRSVWTDPSRPHALSDLPEVMSIDEVAKQSLREATAEVETAAEARADGAQPSEHSVLVPIALGGSEVDGCVRFDEWAPSKGARLRDAHLNKLLASTLSVGLGRLAAAGELAGHADRLRSMALQLSRAEERERRRIAADLHDQIGQTLALSLMKVSKLRSHAATPGMATALEEVRAHVKEALADAKSLMFELSPPVLHQFGLGAALEWLLEHTSGRSGVEGSLQDETGAARFGADEEMFLFRAVQELVTNVHRHAHARRLRIRLQRADGYVVISVADDGLGIPPGVLSKRNSGAPKGFGLFSIEERLVHLGGTFEVGSKPGEGTRVTLRLREERAQQEEERTA